MYQPTGQAVVAILVAGSLAHSLAAGAYIGIAMADGAFQVNRSEVKGNASLFEGTEVTTGEASSKVRIRSGARIEIGTHSQVRVFATQTVLEKGSGQVEGPPTYGIEARTLRITPTGSKTIARVSLDESSGVLVSAVNGPVRVSTASGLLVASLRAGNSYRFQPQAGASDSFEISGCLLRKSGSFIIVEQTTNQVFELIGSDMSSSLGNRVTVKGGTARGAKPLEGAAQVIQVASVTQIGPGGCLAAASSVGADPLPGTSVSPTKEAAKGPNKALIAGVLVAVGGGAGVALAAASKSKSK